jgi:hypothetical protein
VGNHEAAEAAHLVPGCYGQTAMIFPFVVAAPHYFTRTIQLGG